MDYRIVAYCVTVTFVLYRVVIYCVTVTFVLYRLYMCVTVKCMLYRIVIYVPDSELYAIQCRYCICVISRQSVGADNYQIK
jgi:hypothetical protein